MPSGEIWRLKVLNLAGSNSRCPNGDVFFGNITVFFQRGRPHWLRKAQLGSSFLVVLTLVSWVPLGVFADPPPPPARANHSAGGPSAASDPAALRRGGAATGAAGDAEPARRVFFVCLSFLFWGEAQAKLDSVYLFIDVCKSLARRMSFQAELKFRARSVGC